MFIQPMTCELWALVYDAVEIKFTVVILESMEWPTQWNVHMKTCREKTIL